MISREQLAFAFAALLIGISKAGFGGGMGILVGPLLALFFDAKESVAWMLPLLLLCDTIALVPYWKQWDLRNIRNLLPGGVLGIFLGYFALTSIDSYTLAKLIGGLAVIFSLLQYARLWFLREQPLEPCFWHGFLLGLATGFVSTLSHVGGLLTSMYLLMQRLDSRRFVATTTLFYFLINLVKLPVFIYAEMITEETIIRCIPYTPLVIAGTFLGVYLNRRVPDVWFGHIVRVSVLGIGIYLLWG